MKTKTSKKTAARRSNANRAVKKGASTRSKPVSEEKKITIVGKGEHNRREGSRFYKQFELLRRLKGKTVATYIEKGGDRDALNGAIKDGFVKVA